MRCAKHNVRDLLCNYETMVAQICLWRTAIVYLIDGKHCSRVELNFVPELEIHILDWISVTIGQIYLILFFHIIISYYDNK